MIILLVKGVDQSAVGTPDPFNIVDCITTWIETWLAIENNLGALFLHGTGSMQAITLLMCLDGKAG